MSNINYNLLKEEYIPELDITAMQFIHKKSGAELLYLKNKDDNKTFGIAFKTPPHDDTGTPHILEHAVLAGSRKYKTKEPFMNLAQSSMATYLNASTYPDKTLYPIASRNMQDFKNLTDVYLDAVFYPSIYEEEKIFRQEGWRYDLPSVDNDVEYKGVVYSEMRGAYSSPIRVAYQETQRTLLPDTPYAFESGGDPYKITDLDIEDYLNFHKTYYHPSNARVYIYGDLDIEAFLEYLDEDYLSNFDKTEIHAEIPYQEKFTEPKQLSSEYSLAVGESADNKYFATWALILNTFTDIKENFMLEILLDTLFNSQSAPVRLAIEAAELGQDYFADSDLNQENCLLAMLINADKEKAAIFSELIENSLEKVLQDGIDRQALKASINRLEFSLKELNTGSRTGIAYFPKTLRTWLYGGDPVDSLKYADLIAELRDDLDREIWEDFVREKILNNSHKVSIIFKPIAGLNARKDQAVKEQLVTYKENLSDEEITELVEKNQKLYEWQETDDSPELKATIPTLRLSDIDKVVHNNPFELEKREDIVLLKNKLDTSGINYVKYSFDINFLKEEDWFYAKLLTLLLGRLSTEKYNYTEIATLLSLNSGGLAFSEAIIGIKDSEDINLRFEVNSKTLSPENIAWIEILLDIVKSSNFSDFKRVKELLEMELAGRLDDIVSSGNAYGRTRLAAQFNFASFVEEKFSGIDFYLKLKSLIENFEVQKEELSAKLDLLSQQIFTQGSLIVSLVAEDKNMDVFESSCLQFTSELSFAEKAPAAWKFEESKKNEAIKISSNVNYVVKGNTYTDITDFPKYKGDMTVMSSMLRSNYMHVMIRAKGGAYGNGLNISRNGLLIASSYRDPNIKYTLDIYDSLGEYLSNAEISAKDLEEYIIGSVNSFNPVLSPSGKAELEYRRYLSGLRYEDDLNHLEEALSTCVDSIKSYGKMLSEVMDKSNYVVIGNGESIDENKDLFDEIISLN